MRPLFAAFTCLCLAACAGSPSVPERVLIAPGVTLALPSPADLGRRVEAVQMVTARHGDLTFLFEGRLSVTPERLLLVGSDPLGRRALTVTWADGRMAEERAAWLPDGLRPANILADIILLYWPDGVLRQSLAGAGLEQTTTGRKVGGVIELSRTGDGWNGTAHLRHLAWDYDIEVRSVVVEP